MKTVALSLLLATLPLTAFAQSTPSAAPSAAPVKVEVATCNNGKKAYSSSTEHRGMCAGNGGVASWTDGSPVKSHVRKTEYK